MAELYTRKPNTICKICSKAIYRRPKEISHNNGRVFCSAICYGIANRKEVPCVVCGKLILSQFNKKTCSRTCANTHRIGIQYKIGSPKDKVKTLRSLKQKLFLIRGKACERCGYKQYRILQVHHKNRNRNDNELDNLEIICPNCHCLEHYLKNKQ